MGLNRTLSLLPWMPLLRESPLRAWKDSGTLGGGGVTHFWQTETPRGWYKNFMETLGGGGMHFLEAFSQKVPPPHPTGNSEQTLRSKKKPNTLFFQFRTWIIWYKPARKSQKCLKLMIRHQARLIITDKSCDCTTLLHVLSGAIVKISWFISSTSGNYLRCLVDIVSQVNFPEIFIGTLHGQIQLLTATLG